MALYTTQILTKIQIRRVLRWYAKQQQFLRGHGTVATVANSHGVATGVIYRCIDNFKKPPVARKRLRPFGRPGILSALQVRAVRAWYLKKRGFLTSHGTVADLAQELRVTPSAIYACIRRGGVYRSPFMARSCLGAEQRYEALNLLLMGPARCARSYFEPGANPESIDRTNRPALQWARSAAGEDTGKPLERRPGVNASSCT